MKRTTILGFCITALLALAVWAPSVLAYTNHSTCRSCHPITYDNARHAFHRGATADLGVSCDICHDNNQVANSCAVCHDAVPLQTRHVDNYGQSCDNCHASPVPVKNDFNGDVQSDMLFRNKVHGKWYVGLMDATGTNPVLSDLTLPIDPNFELMGTGFFNSDVNADLLFRNKMHGKWYVGLMDTTGTNPVLSNFPLPIDPNFELVGTGYFNSDDNEDLLFRNKVHGKWYVGLMDATGTNPVLSDLTLPIDPNFELVGTGLFNSDVNEDLLFRNKVHGKWYVGLMDATGTNPVLSNFPLPIDPNFELVGTGYFNSDDNEDLLFRNKVHGKWYVGLMDATGTNPTISDLLLPLDLNFELAGTGLFNSDDNEDLLFRNKVHGKWYVGLMDATGTNPALSDLSLPYDLNFVLVE